MRAAASSSGFNGLRSNARVLVCLQHTRALSSTTDLARRVDPLDKSLSVSFKGRQSVSGVTATVFGAYGFVGRYVVSRLGRIGSQVVIPYRGDGMATRHLKLMGDLGQIVQLPMDMTDPDSIRRAVERSNVVINLIGNQNKTLNYSYDDTHVKCIHRVAKICKEAGGVKKFIHVSALGAKPDSNSAFFRSKYNGELAVKDFFPDATIIRPASIWGQEDKFVNWYAEMMKLYPVLPVLDNGKQLIQPIDVQDVAQCIVNCMVDSDAPGKTYELGGPYTLSRSDLINFIANDIRRFDTSIISMPHSVARLYARAAEKFLPTRWRLINPDQIDQMADGDCVVSTKKGTLTCKDLGVEPLEMHKNLSHMLITHRGQRDIKHQLYEPAKGYGKLLKVLPEK